MFHVLLADIYVDVMLDCIIFCAIKHIIFFKIFQIF